MKRIIAALAGSLGLLACNLEGPTTGKQDIPQENRLKTSALVRQWQYTITTVAEDLAAYGVSSMAGDGESFYLTHGYNSNAPYLYKKSLSSTTHDLPALGGPLWKKTQGMAMLGGNLYIVENGSVNRVNKSTGIPEKVTDALFNKTQSMTATASHLYLVHNDRLYRINPNVYNDYKQVGNTAPWKYTGGMAYNPSDTGHIYIVENGYINKVNTSTGFYSKLHGSQLWMGCRGMAYLNGSLYLLFGKDLWRVELSPGYPYESIAREIPTCCGTDVVRNAITAAGNSIYFWAAQGHPDSCDDEGIGLCIGDNCTRLHWGTCGGSGSLYSYIIKVTPS